MIVFPPDGAIAAIFPSATEVDVDATAVPLDGVGGETEGVEGLIDDACVEDVEEPDDAIKDLAGPERDAVYCSALLPTLLYKVCMTPSTLFGVPSLL